MKWDDVRFCVPRLVTCYNEEQQDGPWELAREPDEFSLEVAASLLRVVAACTNLDGNFDPEEKGTTVTEEMRYESMDPGSVFQKANPM